MASLLASCAKGAPGSKPPQATPPTANPVSPTTAPPPPGAQGSGKPLTLAKDAAPQAGAVVAKRDRGLLALYSLDPKKAALPEDFRIGPLSGASAAGLSAEDAETLRRAAAFLADLTKSRIAEELLLPDRKEALSRFIADAIDRGFLPLSFRLGPVNRTEDSGLRVNVRLFGSVGTASGELFFLESERQWMISDIQIRFESLAQQQAPGEEKFFPSSYRWLLDEF